MFTKKYLRQVVDQKSRLFFRGGFSLIVAFLLLLSVAHAETEKVKESAIFLPFNIELSGNYGYLRNGLTSVLASRVSARAKIKVVHGTAAAEKIAAFFKAGQLDKAFQVLDKNPSKYLVMGSLAKDGDAFTLTVNVISGKQGATPYQFSRTAATLDDALPMMDELAWDVAADVFGVPRPKTITSSEDKSDGMSGFQTAHPDRAYKEGLYAGVLPGFESGNLRLLTTKRSQKIPFGINDMDAGDLNGDGTEEVVLAAADRLYIYNYAGEHFKQVAIVELDGYLRIHAISLADLNHNGKLEIYVSANKAGKPESAVVEWDGQLAKKLAKGIPYYLHVASPHGVPVLLGQVGGAADTGAVIGTNVFRLKLGSEGNYVRGEKIILPTGLTVFDVAFADLDGSGEQKMVAIGRKNTLHVYDAAGSLLWTAPGQYGGSSNYLGTMATVARSSSRVYVPPKIVVHDVTGDGIPDIIVGKNRMKIVKYFNRYRYFEGSSLAALSWQQDRLVPVWETKKLPDYTVACQVVTSPADTAGRNKKRFRLFFAQGQNNYSFGFWGKRSTSLFMYEIGEAEEEKNSI